MNNNKSIMLQVDGMRCSGCVGAVQKALLAVPGVKSAIIDLDAGTATIKLSDSELAVDELIGVVKKVGFKSRALA
jgi:copper chaperone CopZ